MVGVYTIEGDIKLNTSKFQTSITTVTSKLESLAKGIQIDNNSLINARIKMLELRDVIKLVSDEARAITEAFNQIRGLKSLIEDLSVVKGKVESLRNDVDRINQSILRENESLNQVNGTKQRSTQISKDILQMAQRELYYAQQQSKAELKIYEDIVKRYEAQGRLVTTVQEQLGLLAERNATEKEEIAFLDEQLMLQKTIHTLTQQGGAENIKQAEGLMKQLEANTEIATVLQEEINLEKQKLKTIEEENAMLQKQEKERLKNSKGNQLDNFSYLPRRIGSMALTMWGYQELMDLYETTTANLNARGSMKYFGDQLMTNERYLTQTNQTLGQVRRGLSDFGTDLSKLQKKYQKIDMAVIGANAEETAYKYGVQADKLGDLAEVYAVYGSEFVKQGRTQEDSVLAINDALDGEVRRLKEVNIKMEDLKAHGYKEGDTASLIDALNEIAKERGYDITAQNITNLSDAITVLELKISQGLASAFEYIEPLLREVAMDFIYMIDAISWAFGKLNRLWLDFSTELDKKFGVRNVQKFGSSVVRVLGAVITLAITFGIVYKIVKSVKGALKGLFGMLGKGTDDIAKTTGDVAKTGGTVGKDSGGGFRDNFMKQWSKTGKDIGKMARVFADVVVGMAMAFVVIEEAILIISGIGYTYDALKPQFESGIEFIKEFGLWFALLGGAMLVFSYALDKVPEGTEKAITKGATRLAYGMAIAIGLIAEAIVLLIAPMTVIALLGGTASFLGTNLDKGLEVISWIGNALHQIDLPMALFIGGFLAVSLLLGLVQPLTLALAVGIASALLLVTEAIVMLIPPLGAIALLGGTASMLGENKIQQGAETIKLIGNVLQVLAQAIPYLLVVDLSIFGVQLVEWGNRLLSGGKDGLTTLVQDILPTIQTFISDFNGLDFSETLDTAKITAIITVATQLPPLFTAIQKLNNAMGTSDALGNIGGALGGSISGAIGMGLKSKLDQLYNDVKDVMDFATKLGGLSTGNGGNTTAIQQTANAIAQLKVKLNLLITTISSASSRVQSASQRLGSAITTGFKTGTASFNSTVVSTLAKGIHEVQSRYATWLSGGKASAQKLADGFKTIGGKLKSSVRAEMGYALSELDNYKDDFYNKGAMLGQSLVDGFKSKKALDQNSPAKITKSIREELGYSMEALNTGKQMMYQGGVALGQALTNGYNSYGNLRTDVGVLASKGVSNEQLQANAKNNQLNGNQKGQTPQLTQTNINIDMSNSTVIGVQDLDNKIRQAVEKAIVSINSPNGAIGY